MHPQFAALTPRWFKRAFVYTGSIGEFRYRFATDKVAGLLTPPCTPSCATSWRGT